jgi:hypothetical protein
MTTYQVYFRGDASSASIDIDADTPQQALALAERLYEDNPSDLWFEPYDDDAYVREIAVCDLDNNELATWRDDELLLRLGARDLLDAAQKVVARWEQGDLAEAVRELSIAIAKATA